MSAQLHGASDTTVILLTCAGVSAYEHQRQNYSEFWKYLLIHKRTYDYIHVKECNEKRKLYEINSLYDKDYIRSGD